MKSFFFLLLFVCFTSAPAFAESAPPERANTQSVLQGLAARVRKITLDNGLRILLIRRPTAPVFAGHVWVKVGGVNEREGITGAAHLLEHMAFKGTDKIGTKNYDEEKKLLERLEVLMREQRSNPEKDLSAELKDVYAKLQPLWVDNEFSRIYQRRGGVGLNAGTAKDYTMYQVQLPNIAFELWCWMESERLLHPVFRQFYKEKQVVREERRMRSEDSPDGRMYERLLATAFEVHPYRFPVIGTAEDLEALTTDDTAALHRAYYRPDNIVLSIVGDIDPETARPLLEKYFGRLPKAEGEVPRITEVEPPQTESRDAVVGYDAEPEVMIAYHKPTYPNPDDLYFSILHALLSGGRSSIFHREFVIKRQLALSVATSEAPGSLYNNLFYIGATPRRGVPTRLLVDEIQSALERFAREGFSTEDFEAARKRVKVGFLSSLDSNDDLAETLGNAELLWGDWEAVMKMYDLVSSATPEDVKALVPKYLTADNRTTVTLVRMPADAAGGR